MGSLELGTQSQRRKQMITLLSWGHKYGEPEANFKFDVSYLKNPWRVLELREASDEQLMKYMESQDEFVQMIDAFVYLIVKFYDMHKEENLRFAFCCSAGEYRSPLVVRAVAKKLKKKSITCKIEQSENSQLQEEI